MHEPRRGERVIEDVAALGLREKMDDACRFFEGQSAEEEFIDQTKDRGIQPDPESESDYGEEGETWRFEDLPKRETKIGEHKTPKVEMRRRAQLDSNRRRRRRRILFILDRASSDRRRTNGPEERQRRWNAIAAETNNSA
jgi:hypothetical protein